MYVRLNTYLGVVYVGLTGSEGVGSMIGLSPLPNDELPNPPPPRPGALPDRVASCLCRASSLAFLFIKSCASFSCVYESM